MRERERAHLESDIRTYLTASQLSTYAMKQIEFLTHISEIHSGVVYLSICICVFAVRSIIRRSIASHVEPKA